MRPGVARRIHKGVALGGGPAVLIVVVSGSLAELAEKVGVVVGGHPPAPGSGVDSRSRERSGKCHGDADHPDGGQQVEHGCHAPRTGSLASVVSSASSAFTSDSRNRR